jgi:hypothetical protein
VLEREDTEEGGIGERKRWKEGKRERQCER